MNCTSCNQGQLSPSFIDGQFRAQTCTDCEGNWILVDDFLSWLEHNPDYEFAKDVSLDTDTNIDDINETKKAMFCPITGIIMTKYRISASTQHRLDYSPATGGIWLDKGEWEIIKNQGLARSLHSVISTKWQSEIQERRAIENFSHIYKDKFGENTYSKLKIIRGWLDKQPQKADLLAYLSAEDPYSAKK